MRQISDYDIYIFDCDGVILDSNQLKIEAMERALSALFTKKTEIDNCIHYFKHNFGKSRFHHIDVFLLEYLNVADQDSQHYRQSILSSYSSMCKKLYLNAEITPDFLDFIQGLQGKKFIASGSEQEELRYVFKQRELDSLFDGIYGSPTPKSENIKKILQSTANNNAIMFGDAISDLNASVDNGIAFIAYLPFSNVKNKLNSLSVDQGFSAYNSWSEII
ncbi:MAG: HAD hydrolase-like protein [Colwellia sp.]|jgi:Predicted phosphatases